jgi:hypothetical protein
VKVSDPDDLLVEAERIRSVFQQAPLVLSATAINSLLTAIVLAPVVNHRILSIWASLIVAVSGIRWIVRQRLLRPALNSGLFRPSAAISGVGSLTTGILWGLGSIVLFPVPETYQLFFAFVIGGMCAGTTAVNSAHMPTVVAFIVPASLPLATRFIADGSTPWLVSGIMVLVFAASLSLASLRAHRSFGERLHLQLALRRQGQELSETNDRLRGEVAERLKAEATLHQAQKIEAIGHLTGGIAHDFNRS